MHYLVYFSKCRNRKYSSLATREWENNCFWLIFPEPIMKPMCTCSLSASCKSVPGWLSTWLKQQPLTCSSLGWTRNRPNQISYHLYVPILHTFYTYVIYVCVIRWQSHKWSDGFSCVAAACCGRTRRVWCREVRETWVEQWRWRGPFFLSGFGNSN